MRTALSRLLTGLSPGGQLGATAVVDERQDPAAISLRHTVLSPIIFLPMVLVIAAIIEGLIVLTRRMVRGPVTFPPLPRL